MKLSVCIYMYINSQSLVFSDGESGCGHIGEEMDTVRGLVARFTLHSARTQREGSLPVATTLSRVVTHDGHTHQLQTESERRGDYYKDGICSEVNFELFSLS